MKRFFVLLALAACSPTPSPVPPDADAGAGRECVALCDHERTYGCPEAAPTPAGSSCETVCVAAQQVQPWPLDAMVSATSCAGIADAMRHP